MRTSSRTVARTVALVALAAVTAVTAACRSVAPAATPVPAPTRREVGFALGAGAFGEGHDALRDDLAAIAGIGATWVRLDVDWSTLEPEPGTIDFATIDQVADAARASGLQILGLLAYTPAWARPPGTTDKHPPTDPAHFARFAAAVAAHLGPKVAAWEIWNEPNSARFWAPRPDVSAYADLLTRAAAAIHGAAPAGTAVVSGGLAPGVDAKDGSEVSPDTFLGGLLDAGAGQAVDGVGVHPYSYPALPSDAATAAWNTFVRLPRLHDRLVAAGLPDRALWLTEVGAPTGTGERAVSEQRQAAIVVDAVSRANALAWVAHTFVFTHRDSAGADDDIEAHFGLLAHDGAPKAAWPALQRYLQG